MLLEVLSGCPQRFTEGQARAWDEAPGGLGGLRWVEWRGISLWCAALLGMNGSGGLFGSPCGSFPTCCLTLPLGLQVVLFSSLLAAGTAAGTTGDVGGPTPTTPATASLVSIGRCPVVELAAKGKGAPAGAVAPAVLLGSLLFAEGAPVGAVAPAGGTVGVPALRRRCGRRQGDVVGERLGGCLGCRPPPDPWACTPVCVCVCVCACVGAE